MTITTTRWVLSGALALGALGAVGGFTPGVPSADAAPSVSPFAGTYLGRAPWGSTFLWPITISDGGRITSSYEGDGRAKGSMSGQVDDSGSYSVKVSETYYVGKDFSGREGSRTGNGWVTGVRTVAGTITPDVDGNIVVSVGAWGSTTWVRQ